MLSDFIMYGLLRFFDIFLLILSAASQIE